MTRLLATTAVCLVLAAGELSGQAIMTGEATATAQLAEGLTLIKNDDLRFGAMISPGTAGTVVVAPSAAGTPTYNGITGLPGGTSAALFTAAQTNPGNMHFWISLPQQISICFGACTPATSMLVDAFTAQNASGPALNPNCVAVGAAIAGGPKGQCPDVKLNDPHPFYVGARLNVGANQSPGMYAGSFNVTVHSF